MKKKTLLVGAAAVAAVLWATLFFSNHGVLVWGGIDTDREVVKVLECRYFTGTGFVKKEYLHGRVMGRESCPRWVSLGD